MSAIYRRLTADELRVLDRLRRARDRRAHAWVGAEFGRAEAGVARALRAALNPDSPRRVQREAELAALEADGLAREVRAGAADRFAQHQWRRAATRLFGPDDADR